MAHSVVIRDVVYSDCPAVTIPKYGASGDAVTSAAYLIVPLG